MKKSSKALKRLIICTLAFLLVACSAQPVNPSPQPDSHSQDNQEDVSPPNSEKDNEVIDDSQTTEDIDDSTSIIDNSLSETDKNSYAMLFYLGVTAEEIRISKGNRLVLDDIYTALLNDIDPGKVDEDTQKQMVNLRDVIKGFRDVTIKRERLQYIYNQKKAAAIRNAVPNPLAILNITEALDWKKLVTSIVYTVVDSYVNYKNAGEQADTEFLYSGWELDDKETKVFEKSRESTYDYMVDILQKYPTLDGKKTLNEKEIQNFAKICSIENKFEKIQRLESENKTYSLFGNYWLELADSYYETNQYEKCLQSIKQYESLNIDIYKKDYNYATVLPKIIVAAQNMYSDDSDQYIENVGKYTEALVNNITTDNWANQYFAAEIYLDLYNRSSNEDYLKTAYDIAINNVTVLLEEQRKLNNVYLSEVKEETISEPNYKYMSDDEKKKAEKEYKDSLKKLKAYNKSLVEARKTELPSLYEPLVMNCDLLFGLAEELKINNSEKEKIENILQTSSNGIFLPYTINNQYSFASQQKDYHIELEKDKIIIPVSLLYNGCTVNLTITDGNDSIDIKDCAIKEVKRNGTTIDSFDAYYNYSNKKWSENTKVTVSINNGNEDVLTFHFKVKEHSGNWILPDKVVFEEE